MTLHIEKERTRDKISLVIKIEGKIAGSAIAELKTTYASLTVEEKRRFYMDLEWITFVDERGQALLKSMIKDGGQILRSNLYIDSLLGLGRDFRL